MIPFLLVGGLVAAYVMLQPAPPRHSASSSLQQPSAKFLAGQPSYPGGTTGSLGNSAGPSNATVQAATMATAFNGPKSIGPGSPPAFVTPGLTAWGNGALSATVQRGAPPQGPPLVDISDPDGAAALAAAGVTNGGFGALIQSVARTARGGGNTGAPSLGFGWKG